MAKDLVCGMTVDESTPAETVEYNKKTYYFCSSHCAKEFREHADKYVEKEELHD